MVKVLFLIKRLTILGITAYVVLFLNGCAKTQFDDVWESSLKGCSGSGNCHAPGGTASPGPDMSTQDKFYANVVGKTVATVYPEWTINHPTAPRTSTCNNLQMIKSGDANKSSVVASLVFPVSELQTCNTSFNAHLNLQETTTENNWSELVKWINDGAPKE